MNLKEKFDAGYEIKNLDGTIALQVIVKKSKNEDPYIVEWSDGIACHYNNNDEGKYFTCTPPKKRVTTNFLIDHKGNAFITGAILANDGGCSFIRITTEQQPDGSWKIIEDTDRLHI